MFIVLLKIIGGIALLVLGGKYLVKGGVELTKYFNISKLVVGMTVVALGTSAPELLVSVQAALKDAAAISIGNVIGSNIANIALVLAATIIILPMTVKKQTIKLDWPIMAVTFVMLFIFMLDGKLTRLEGLIFIASLIAYIIIEIRFSLKENKNTEPKEEKKEYSVPIALVIIIISSVGLAFGANILVDGASELARLLNISERIISISIVALGTSLPELTASIVAALKKETDISVGNIIGSNIFNILAILGTTAVISPISFNQADFLIDLIWMSAIGVLLFISFLPYNKRFIHRFKGFILLAIYIIYMILLFVKQ